MPVQLREVKPFDWLAYKANLAASVLLYALRNEPVANSQYRGADERAIERSVTIAEKMVQRLKGGEK
jgi:hypothetical protein